MTAPIRASVTYAVPPESERTVTVSRAGRPAYLLLVEEVTWYASTSTTSCALYGRVIDSIGEPGRSTAAMYGDRIDGAGRTLADLPSWVRPMPDWLAQASAAMASESAS